MDKSRRAAITVEDRRHQLDARDRAAFAIIEAERELDKAKQGRLRALRLARDANTPPPEPKRKRKTTP